MTAIVAVCPDENSLGDFARGQLDEDEHDAIEAHLGECEPCSEVVAQLVKIFRSAFVEDSAQLDEPVSSDDLDRTVSAGPMLAAEKPLAQGDHLGRYVVLHAVGAGAMGVVYAAYDPKLDRKVALKLLKPAIGEATQDSRAERNRRLLREAQALARLSHPGVIAVHDVGTTDDQETGQVFLAMEFVDGGTLTEWLIAEPRDWRQVLEVFTQAGEGLAAAHEAGLVHRDFKPDNVLIRSDGRAVVTDFGLARPAASSTEDERTIEQPLPEGLADSVRASASGGSALSATLTRTGALVGTPAYMAPEQLDGQRGDPLSDQFGFCVALYEGLYGERPFAARSLAGLIAAVFEGNIPPPPRGREVPRWLRQAAVQGLRTEPGQRHPSMRALLSALRPPRLASWKGLVAMGTIGAIAGASALALGGGTRASEPVAYCDDVAAKLDGVWDSQRKDEVVHAFEQTSLPFAADVATRVVEGLDDYGERWVDAQTQTCRQGVEGQEPDAVIALRSTCLSRRRHRLGAMVHALTEADANTVMQAVDGVAALAPVEACNELVGNELAAVPPDQREPVDRARRLIDDAIAVQSLGKMAQSLEKLDEAKALVEPLDYPPITAEVLTERGLALVLTGEHQAAEPALHDALHAAIASRHHAMVAKAAANLAYLENVGTGQGVVSKRWCELGLAALDALGQPDHLGRAELLSALSGAQRRAGDLEASIETARASIALREQQFGPDHHAVGEPLSHLGMTLARQGKYDESVEHLSRAQRILGQTYGPNHPNYAAILQNIGTTHFVHGHYDRSLEIYREAYEIIAGLFDKDHPSVGVLAYNIATALAFMERYDEALEYAQQAQRIEQAVSGADSASAATGWALEGEIHLRAGRGAQAAEAIERALTLSQAATPDDYPRHANYKSQLGIALLVADRVDEAEERLTSALEFQRTQAGEQPDVSVAETTGRLAMVHLRRGQLDQAQALIDESIAAYLPSDPDPHQHAEAYFRRAQVAAARGDNEAARADAKRSEEIYARLDQQPKRRAAVARLVDALPE